MPSPFARYWTSLFFELLPQGKLTRHDSLRKQDQLGTGGADKRDAKKRAILVVDVNKDAF